MMETSERVLYLYDWVASIPAVDAGHDFSHILRVATHALRLFQEEIQDLHHRDLTNDERDAVMAAALLHDCVPIAKNSPLRKESSRLASEKAAEIMRAQKNGEGKRVWSEDWIHEVSAAIHDHSFSSGRFPQSLLGKCLQDADRLEALGAIGLYRTIATGVSMGAQLFDPLDPWAKKRELDDRRFSIDHFFTKLLRLPQTFNTPSGKKEAERRAEFLQDFIDQLRSEL